MAEMKRIFRFYGAWNGKKECDWLGRMAAGGWHLRSYFFGVYYFAKDAPGDYVYEHDFHILRGEDLTEYLNLYADSGWQHVTSFANWHYFRSPSETAERRPVFSDVPSQRAKLLRVLTVLLLSIVPMTMFGIVNPILNGYLEESRSYYAIGGFALFAIIACAYGAIRIGIKIKRLGRS